MSGKRVAKLLLAAGVVGLSLVACGLMEPQPIWSPFRLYDLKTGAVLTGRVDSNRRSVDKTVEVTMPNGEVCTGEYRIVQAGAVSWGRVYSTVWGNSYRTESTARSTSAKGMGIVTGPRGTVLECEFLVGERQGFGACSDNHQHTYKVLF